MASIALDQISSEVNQKSSALPEPLCAPLVSTDMISAKLKELNLSLPPVAPPGGSYTSVNVRSNTAYVAIQFPILGDDYQYLGRYGWELSTEDGYQAAQLAALNILAQVEHYVGFVKVEGLNHLDIYYQCAVGWDEAPMVADGASELFVKVLGDRGTHTRGIYGVDNLARNFSVGITSSFTLLT
jgi:hypothetical protein